MFLLSVIVIVFLIRAINDLNINLFAEQEVITVIDSFHISINTELRFMNFEHVEVFVEPVVDNLPQANVTIVTSTSNHYEPIFVVV